MIKLPNIPCSYQNHRAMNYQYVCLNQLCLQNNRQIACLYCCEQYHNNHMKDVVAIKMILEQMSKHKERKGYNILKILLQGIEFCQNLKQLRVNFSEILAYRNNSDRFEELIDEQMQALQKNTAKYYQRINQRQTSKNISEKSSQMHKPYITPILNFKQGPNYILNSPFSVTAAKQELTTVFAFPTLSKFHDSIDITIKIDRYTPSWLAIGLSQGISKYQENSPKHILAISNGWVSNKGVVEKSKFRFGGGETLRIKWDKNMQMLEMVTSKRDRIALKYQNKWNEEIYLCAVLFYKGDSIHILS